MRPGSGPHHILSSSSSRRTCLPQTPESRREGQAARSTQQARRLLPCFDASGGPGRAIIRDLVSPATQRYNRSGGRERKKLERASQGERAYKLINSTVIPSPLSASSSLTVPPLLFKLPPSSPLFSVTLVSLFSLLSRININPLALCIAASNQIKSSKAIKAQASPSALSSVLGVRACVRVLGEGRRAAAA